MPETIPAIFAQTVAQHGGKTALVYKDGGTWHPISYSEFQSRAERVTAALIGMGVVKGDRIAILSENRPEWVVCDQGILAAGAVDVPIYPTLSAQQIHYILSDCGAKAIFLSSRTHLKKVLEVAGDLPQLGQIVMFEGKPEGDAQQELLSWQEVQDKGAKLVEATVSERKARLAGLTSEDLASFIYTSGTTGNPKGVMLTQGNLVSNCSTITPIIEFGNSDSCLSFLPLSHVFERIAYNAFVTVGATIYYAESIDTLSANLLEVKPTVLVSVPRVFEKIRARVYDSMADAGGLKAKIFAWAMKVGREARLEKEKVGSLSPIGALQLKLADRLVFSKIRERTGGRIRYAVCGGAPLSREVAEFFETIGIMLLEGYGMTESSPVIACNLPTAKRLGTVGRPIPGVEVRIASDGEILCKGPNVMRGYFNMPEATADAIDADGWLHTGDIGEFDPDGFLKITDRKKEILVMSNGKNVAPAPIENALITSPYIAQAVILGDNRNFVSALIVPNFEGLERWARGQGVSGDRANLAQDPKVKALLREEIDRVTADFAKFEKVKEFAILDHELSQEGGELTPTLKFKRRVIHEHFKDAIDAIYSAPAPVGA